MIAMTDMEFAQLAELIKARTGIHLKTEKRAMMAGRLQKIVQDKGMTSFSEYYRFLQSQGRSDTAELALLVDKISTNHTFFMRERGHFAYFQQNVLPELMNRQSDRDLRVWSAGCSSGEEPYVLSMLIDEAFTGGRKGWDTQLLATDISHTALEMARRGKYGADALQELPERWIKKYFEPSAGGEYSVKPNIRSQVLFRKFNLMEEQFPFTRRFHAIFCRNVMIYFDQATRYKLVRKFYEWTEPGGYLFIGHSESLERERTAYRYIMPAVYHK
ncbi:Chemotaxis protein methyltransferase Cher2 [Paenibacillus auburnensis]|uniref:protein-glutamate O-methyltransferase n=1 Tax=Paenibacillus auburnensis TaxID=2905649 RepID=A0ABM9BN21_9BACL|nr:protein-glutamate O-methyltransferase CheR [Paenibacillus auburnensis]CAH1190606.1 Chemotaxis protein methyltransferase Cher2 [Paenibacillus auburnensis]